MPAWQKRLLVGAIALVVLGLLAWPKVQPLLANDGSDSGAGPPRGGGAPSNVVGYVAEPRLMRDRIRATGSLIADEAVDLAAEVSAPSALGRCASWSTTRYFKPSASSFERALTSLRRGRRASANSSNREP